MLALDLQEGSIEDVFAFIKGVFLEDCAVAWQLWALGSQQ